MTFHFHLKLYQIKVISQDHCVVPYKAVTLTAGHDLGQLKVKGQGLTLKCQSQSGMSDWLGEREFKISLLKD